MIFETKNHVLICNKNIRVLYDIENGIIYNIPSIELFNLVYSYMQNTQNLQYFDSMNSELISEINYIFSVDNTAKKSNPNTFQNLQLLGSSNKITLMITQDCNLKCRYCYGGDSGSYNSKISRMSYDIAKRSIDFLLSNSMETKKFHITFFGGEPLLEFKLIKRIIQYCQSIGQKNGKQFSYSLTTNGTLINEEIVKFFSKNHMNLMISLDGSKIMNDKNRIYINGKGTYNDIVRSLKLLNKYKKRFTIRATYDSCSFDEYFDRISHFKEIGASQIYMSPKNNYHGDLCFCQFDFDYLEEFQPKMINFMRETENKIINNEKPFYIPFLAAINKIHFLNNRMLSCGVFRGTTAVSTDGGFYPCHRFVGMDGFNFGDVFSGVSNNKIKKICDNLDKETIECNACFARYICSRGCIRDIASKNGQFINYDMRFCSIMKKNVYEFLTIYSKLKLKRPDIFEKIDKMFEKNLQLNESC